MAENARNVVVRVDEAIRKLGLARKAALRDEMDTARHCLRGVAAEVYLAQRDAGEVGPNEIPSH